MGPNDKMPHTHRAAWPCTWDMRGAGLGEVGEAKWMGGKHRQLLQWMTITKNCGSQVGVKLRAVPLADL